jgi:hypothetical protein
MSRIDELLVTIDRQAAEIRAITAQRDAARRDAARAREDASKESAALRHAALHEAVRAAAAAIGLAPSAVSDAVARLAEPGVEWRLVDGGLRRYRDGREDLSDDLRPIGVAEALRALRPAAGHLFGDASTGAMPAAAPGVAAGFDAEVSRCKTADGRPNLTRLASLARHDQGMARRIGVALGMPEDWLDPLPTARRP